MVKSLYTKNNQQVEKFIVMCEMLNTLPDKIPDNLKYVGKHVDIANIIKETTESKEKDFLGLFISSDDLRDLSQYLMNNIEDFNDEITVFGHCRSHEDISTDIRKSDSAEVRIVGKERIIVIYANSMHPKMMKVGSFINVMNTSWKKLPMYRTDKDKKEVILQRIIVESAMNEENIHSKKYRTEQEYLNEFFKVKAVDIGTFVKNLSNEYKDFHIGVHEQGIYKMVYNKIKNNTLDVKSLAVRDNETYICLIYNNKPLEFRLSMNKLAARRGD